MIVLKIVWVLSSEGLGGTVISLTTSVFVPSMGLLSILMRVCRTVARAISSMFPSTYVFMCSICARNSGHCWSGVRWGKWPGG